MLSWGEASLSSVGAKGIWGFCLFFMGMSPAYLFDGGVVVLIVVLLLLVLFVLDHAILCYACLLYTSPSPRD